MGGRAAGKRSWPGCTALALLLQGSRMLVANAGHTHADSCAFGQLVFTYCAIAELAQPRSQPVANNMH